MLFGKSYFTVYVCVIKNKNRCFIPELSHNTIIELQTVSFPFICQSMAIFVAKSTIIKASEDFEDGID